MTPRISAAQRRTLQRQARAHAAGVLVAERAFKREVLGIMRGFHSALLDYIEPAARALVDAKKKPLTPVKGKPTKTPADVDKAVAHLEPQIAPMVAKAHVKLEGALAKNYAATMDTVMPIGWQTLPSMVQAEAQKARDWAISLVEDAARVYAGDVKDILGNPSKTFGMQWRDIRDLLLDRGNVSESRAELIARDQTLKLNGAIAKANQEASGITRYMWSTSKDERVRPTHRALEGQVFAWASPPPVGHPGQDFQCRCVAMPVLGD